ncbi:MAG: hypothetical protein EBR02_00420 [Alphaproteobacteria bacterium]|nr:hypothetical protein [Alphaproteobacteria bacterium]
MGNAVEAPFVSQIHVWQVAMMPANVMKVRSAIGSLITPMVAVLHHVRIPQVIQLVVTEKYASATIV